MHPASMSSDVALMLWKVTCNTWEDVTQSASVNLTKHIFTYDTLFDSCGALLSNGTRERETWFGGHHQSNRDAGPQEVEVRNVGN